MLSCMSFNVESFWEADYICLYFSLSWRKLLTSPINRLYPKGSPVDELDNKANRF